VSEPVPHTGRSKQRKYKSARTGSVLSKALPHRYADEGDKGPWLRRVIRRREERFWRRGIGS
jgi:hypothetical protein